MKKLIIYSSVHHGNTEKIAKAMGAAINADVIKAESFDVNNIENYALIGFGSGIYGGKMHKTMLNLIESLPVVSNKKAFVFSTSGMGKTDYNNALAVKLADKGFVMEGSFACKGFDTFGPFKLVGGIAKGRPNDEDILNAKNFVLKFIEYA
ncbi:MAG: flavodoxin family protein [Solirubrobacterales bacterium]